MAKLNRMKIERIARIRAGLPDEHVNRDYTEQDYKGAMDEMREPQITEGKGDSAGDGRRTRAPSKEEMAALVAAEEAVKRALTQGTAPPSQDVHIASRPTAPPGLRQGPQLTAKEEEMLDRLVRKGPLSAAPLMNPKVPSPSTAKTAPASSIKTPPPPSPPAAAIQQTSPIPVAPSPPVPKASPAPITPPPSVPKASPARAASSSSASGATPTPPVASWSPKSAPEMSAKGSAKIRPKPRKAPKKPDPSESALAAARKLTNEEMETLAEALQLLVKHRGGGPFGLGRVQGEEAQRLAEALLDSTDVFRRDTNEALALQEVRRGREQEKEKSVKPLKPQASGSGSGSSGETPASPVTPPPPPPLPTQPLPPSPSLSAPSPSLSAPSPSLSPVTISVSAELNDLIIKANTAQDLETLRNDLARALAIVQMKLDSIPPSSPSLSLSSSPPQTALPSPPSSLPPSPSSSSVSAATPSVLSEDTDYIDKKELKIAIGLLLKHRGGPGFGHGRLQGAELKRMQETLRKVSTKLLQEAQEAEEIEEEEE
eukprot:CAMPEP_0182439842 /NCGR_PEP_ID=MMETSP1167-20130531/86687_1 /TAXON_ID=2988 /ORGANISM="Mallomonas Sp, Strain CCMP3275" /LENGTH=541 /DNA_ID=CAMNT_0024633637 /DNA_START=381 /DNA_END=2006 /DNA_ORIENTATION=+